MLAIKILHFFNCLFDKTPDAYDEELKKRKEVRNLEEKIAGCKCEVDSWSQIVDGNKEELRKKKDEYKEFADQRDETKLKIDKLETKKKQLDDDVSKAVKNYEKLSKELTEKLDRDFSTDLDRVVLFDSNFLNEMFGTPEERKKAHCKNPWETDRFKREREKLFACALLVLKHFVDESNYCKRNLKELDNYWGNRKKDEFKDENVKALFPVYFQSLLLVIPVVSTTFASVGRMLKDMEEPNLLGTLIVDEAGQALPQMAVGALYRCRKAVVVGDPAQVQPIVTEDLNIIRRAFGYGKKGLKEYVVHKTLSVQSFADVLNKFGTDGIFNEWTGTPLLIHRRCISPMFEISNELSYKGKMINESSEPKSTNYYLPYSVWIDDRGKEKDKRNHFVPEQGDKVWEILTAIFSRNTDSAPSVFVITPFKSVENEIKKYIKTKAKQDKSDLVKRINEFSNRGIGTIHTFQGKEADEVIFVLGCDETTGNGTFDFVDESIVNVAVSRAKYRLYIVGDVQTWTKKNQFLEIAKKEINAKLFEKLKDDKLTNNEKKKIVDFLRDETIKRKNSENEEEESFDTTILTSNFARYQDILKNLTPDKLQRFGFNSFDEMNNYSKDVKENLQLGMYIYYSLMSLTTEEIDVSFSSILFCKAIEQQLKNSLLKPLKKYCGDFMMKCRGKLCSLSQLEDKDITIGTFSTVFNDRFNEEHILQDSQLRGDESYRSWYKSFKKKLEICRQKRNDCCHPNKYRMEDQKVFFNNVFFNCDKNEKGIFFESVVGEKM